MCDVLYNGSLIDLDRDKITIFENDTIAIDIMEADYDSCLHYEKTITWIYKDGRFVTTAKMVEDITDALMVLFKP